MRQLFTIKNFEVKKTTAKFWQNTLIVSCLVFMFACLCNIQKAESQNLLFGNAQYISKLSNAHNVANYSDLGYYSDFMGLNTPCIPVSVTTSDITTCAGNPASIGQAIGGATEGLTYQWQVYPGVDLANSGVYSNVNSHDMSISDVSGLDGTQYRVITTFDAVTYCSASVTSNFMTLHVYAKPTVTITPSDPVCQGQSGTLTAVVTNTAQSPAPYSYDWYDAPGSPTTQSIVVDVNTTYHIQVIDFHNCYNLAEGNLTVNQLPLEFNVTGGGPYCLLGGSGMPVGLDGSEVGVNYQLVLNGTTNMGVPKAGTGSALSWGNQTVVGTYTVTALNPTTGCFSNMLGNAVILINLTPEVRCAINPESGVVCEGAEVIFTGTIISGTNTQACPMSYTWKDPTGAVVSNALTLDLKNVTTAASGTYIFTATNCCGSVSCEETLLVNKKPTVSCSINPSNGILCVGESATFTGTIVSGTNTQACPMTFTWKDKTGAVLSNTLTLVLNNVTTAASGTYTFTATNCCGSDACSKDLLVNQKPTVSCAINPSNGILCVGESATFTGTIVSGTNTQACPMTFTWKDKTGAVLSNSLTLVLNNVTTAASGTYTFTATNCCGSDACSKDLLVNQKPTVSCAINPSNGILCVGESATFTGTIVSGTNTQACPMTYTWKDKTGAVLSNSLTLVLNNVTTAASGTYTFTATNCCGSDACSKDLLVNQKPTVSCAINPESGIVCEGANVEFTGSVLTGTNTQACPITVTWKNPSGEVVSNSLVLDLSNVTTLASGTYTFTASNCCGTASCTKDLLVNKKPTVSCSINPSNGILCVGESATFTGTIVSGTNTQACPMTYTWKDKTGAVLSNSLTLVLNNVTTAASGTYTFTATNCCGSASCSKDLTVNTPPVITSFVSPQLCIPSQNLPPRTFLFTVSATGTQPLSYQWYKGGVALSGETNTSYTFASNNSADAVEYKVVVSNSCGSTNASATLSSCTCTPPEILPIPDQRVCAGTPATFNVLVTGGTQPLVYQWFMANGTPLSGETNNTFTTTVDGSYYVVVTSDPVNCNESATSNIFTLTVDHAPQVSCAINPENGIVCEDANVTFTGSVLSGTDSQECPLTVTWKDPSGKVVSNSVTLDLTNVTSSASGTYTFTASNCCGSASCSKDLLVNKKPTVSCAIIPENGQVCTGASVTFTGAVLSGTNTQACPITFTWTDPKGNVVSNSLTLILTNVTTAASGTYTFTATNCCGSASCTKDLLVNPNLAVTCMASSTKAKAGDLQLFSVTVTSGVNVTYQWKFDGVAISGETNSSYTRTLLSSDNNKQVCVDINSTCGSKTCCTTLTLTTCEGFATFTKGGWGTTCHGGNPGCLRDRYFSRIFPFAAGDPSKPGLVVGIISSGNYLQLTNSAAVNTYLPYGGPSVVLTKAYINPAAKALKNDVISQLVALKCNVYYGAAGLMGTNTNLGNLCFINGTLAGTSIYTFLAYADDAVSGVNLHGLTIGDYNTIATSINEGFEGGTLIGTLLDCVCQPIGKSSKLMNSSSDEIKVYPNPTSGMINVVLPSTDVESQLSIFNVSGQLVFNERVTNPDNNTVKQIDMTAHQPGVYFIRISNSQNVKTYKFILQ